MEHLEAFAAHSDAEETTVDKLKTTIVHLELEETKKNEERQRNAMVSKARISTLRYYDSIFKSYIS